MDSSRHNYKKQKRAQCFEPAVWTHKIIGFWFCSLEKNFNTVETREKNMDKWNTVLGNDADAYCRYEGVDPWTLREAILQKQKRKPKTSGKTKKPNEGPPETVMIAQEPAV
jgi:hypothetical protein